MLESMVFSSCDLSQATKLRSLRVEGVLWHLPTFSKRIITLLASIPTNSLRKIYFQSLSDRDVDSFGDLSQWRKLDDLLSGVKYRNLRKLSFGFTSCSFANHASQEMRNLLPLTSWRINVFIECRCGKSH
jgi:hypothetical protein